MDKKGPGHTGREGAIWDCNKAGRGAANVYL